MATTEIFTLSLHDALPISTSGFLVFCIAIAGSDYGRIRLGADGEAPEFSYLTWLGMIFSAGMGVGLVFWAVAEPMSHFVRSEERRVGKECRCRWGAGR